MKYMLDTCTFLWLVTEDHGNLNPRIVEIFLHNDNEIVFSVVSAWEISIKASIEKLDLQLPARDFLESQIYRNGLSLLPVSLDHVIKVAELPFHHKDPNVIN